MPEDDRGGGRSEPAAALTLADLEPQAAAVIAALDGLEPAARQRILEMGLTPGAACVVVRRAPFGDPIEVRLRGYSLSLRRHEAEAITVARAP